ncbi:unnamed protein product [marine sediment metagenome]|uniref:Uncharacterized protein n=1 Tax=marine sediment metagenome TaxID=412755 RepID=X1R4C8_9ZZZZ
MEKRVVKTEGDEILSRDNIVLLSQLVKSLEKAGLKLEEAYEKKDNENLSKTKKFILRIQTKIVEIMK